MFSEILWTTCGYTCDSFWFRVEIINPNLKAELPRTFHTYEHFVAQVETQHGISQLAAEFLEYQACALKEIVEPLLFWRLHVPDCPILSRWIFWSFPHPVRMLKSTFSRFPVIDRKELAAITVSNITNCACIYCNTL